MIMIDKTRKMFRFRLTHDNGTVNVTIPATDEETAIYMVMLMENCPRRAIETLPFIGDDSVHVPDPVPVIPEKTYNNC